MSSMRRSSEMNPPSTSTLWQTPYAHSSPMMPLGASRKPSSFSSMVWGAWSVANKSTVPSATAAMVAWRSASERSGGFILAKVPYLSSASSFNAM
ncbi:unknown [Bifidobacterium adolescentis CAG:119]|nr:unknown [Bifidobacterium adolescentis CAG:119]